MWTTGYPLRYRTWLTNRDIVGYRKETSLTPIGNSSINVHDYTGNWTKFIDEVHFLSRELDFNVLTIANSSRCVVALTSEVTKGEWVPVDCDVPLEYGSVICKRKLKRAVETGQNAILKRNSKECHYNGVMVFDMCVTFAKYFNSRCSFISYNMTLFYYTKLKVYLASRHVWNFGFRFEHSCKCVLNLQFYLDMKSSDCPALREMTCNCSDVSQWLCSHNPIATNIENTRLFLTGRYYVCNDKTLITKHLRCDNKTDCYDKSEESDCTVSDWMMYTCTDHGNIHLSLLCDGIAQCADLSDEAACLYTYSPNIRHLIAPQYEDCRHNSKLSYCISGLHCFKSNRLCVYERTLTGQPYHCNNTDHLRRCLDHVCPTFYKCPSSYCIPYHLICDEVIDCPNGEDEEGCPVRSCAGLFKCQLDDVCVHPLHICDGIPDCPSSLDDEAECDAEPCPSECECTTKVIFCNRTITDKNNFGVGRRILILRNFNSQTMPTATSMRNAIYLDISSNNIVSTDMLLFKFRAGNAVIHMNLDNNKLTHLYRNMFQNLRNVRNLTVSNNSIFKVYSFAFMSLNRLTMLDLSSQNIHFIEKYAFHGLTSLLYLDLSNNTILIFRYDMSEPLLATLMWLNIENNNIQEVKYKKPYAILRSFTLVTNSYGLCCLSGQHFKTSCHLLLTEILSKFCRRKLPTWTIIASYGLISSVVILVNLVVIYFHSKTHQHTHSILIRVLSFTDMSVLFYYLLIALAYHNYGHNYIFHYNSWVKSSQCALARSAVPLSMLYSTVVSMLIVLNQLVTVRFRYSRPATINTTKVFIVLCVCLVMSAAISFNLHNAPTNSLIMHANCIAFSNTDGKVMVWLSIFLSLLGLLPCLTLIINVFIFQYVQTSAKRAGRKNTKTVRKLQIRASFMIIAVLPQWVILCCYVALISSNIQSKYLENTILIFVLPSPALTNSILYTFHSQTFIDFIRFRISRKS